MPVLQFITNLPTGSIPGGFASRAAGTAAEMLGTPPKAVVVMVRHQSMYRGGSDASRLNIKLACVDAFNDHAKNRAYSERIIDFAAQELGIPHERIVLTMENQNMWEIGVPGGTLLGDRMKNMQKKK